MKNKNTKEIVIKIEGEDWEKALDHAFEKANAKAKIDGFRPGKAPKDVFLKKYGKAALYEEATDSALQVAYAKMIEDNKDLEIVAQPMVDINGVDDNAIEFKFTLTLKPELKLGQYKDLKVKKEKVEVTKEEIAAAIKEMLNKYAESVVKEGAIEANDTAIIDFEGFKDGVPFEGGKAENYSLVIGSNTFIPGFEDQLIGAKKGEEKEVKVTFPEDYHAEDLKGKEVVFKVKVNDVKTTVIPELTKEFFEDLGMEGIDTKESLEKHLEETIKARKDADVENKYIDELLAAAAKNVTVDVPDAMVDEEVNRMINNYKQHLSMQGLTIEQFYQITNSTEADLKEKMKEEASNRVVQRLMLEQIMKEEKIEATDKEAEERAEELSKRYNVTKEELLKEFGGLDMVKYDLQIRRAIEIIKGEK